MNRPRSTTELNEQANLNIDPNIPIRLYIRSAALILRQAKVYELEHDLEKAYILYMKYSNLSLNELPKHPSYKHPDNKQNLRALNVNCMDVLDSLEQLKPVIDKRYDDYIAEQHDMKESEAASLLSEQMNQWNSNKQYSEEETQVGDFNLQEELKGLILTDDMGSRSAPSIHHEETQYPDIRLNNQSDGFRYQPRHIYHPVNVPPYPTLPPKIPIDRPLPISPKDKPPLLPPKIKLEEEEPPCNHALTERGEPLRTLVLPRRLQNNFLKIADHNTQKKIETCGILAGTLKNNILRITTLIIPKQIGTTDTCTTENEEELFDVQDKHDLLTFGWIHTHPTQSCFLSSVDLHTHCSYQLMLPEAIAIVCAPSQTPNFGVFRLTDPPGLDIISNCKKQPAFHPHPDLPIYTSADDDGHIMISDYDFQILDLRG
ncbi:hypothetical protein BDB01DRAFT_474916 [Pilobolus umbonatus]|nr:hypothetical protein BDB01DRAFT_474916 [Pilobolus umbonatus]